jgi:hypothetical protein
MVCQSVIFCDLQENSYVAFDPARLPCRNFGFGRYFAFARPSACSIHPDDPFGHIADH